MNKIIKKEINLKSGKNILRGNMEQVVNHENENTLVLLFHGLCSHRNTKMFQIISEYFLSKGIGVLRFDFNGHGQSEGKQEDMTILNEIEDAKVIMDYALSQPCVDNLILLGHSQGGVVTSMLAPQKQEKVKAMILLAPGYKIEEAAQACNFGNIQYDMDHLPEKVQVLDWNYNLGREYLFTTANLNIRENSKGFSKPVCVIQGESDDYLPMETVKDYISVFPKVELHGIFGANHIFWKKMDQVIDVINVFCQKERLFL